MADSPNAAFEVLMDIFETHRGLLNPVAVKIWADEVAAVSPRADSAPARPLRRPPEAAPPPPLRQQVSRAPALPAASDADAAGAEQFKHRVWFSHDDGAFLVPRAIETGKADWRVVCEAYDVVDVGTPMARRQKNPWLRLAQFLEDVREGRITEVSLDPPAPGAPLVLPESIATQVASILGIPAPGKSPPTLG